jgi:hypothetical protein
LDIETAPIVSCHWDLWDQNIGLEQIQVEWAIISFSAKWLGEKRVTYRDTGGRGPKRVREDGPLMNELWTILDRADIVVAQNGAAFDSNKLAWLSKHLTPAKKSIHKRFPGFLLWDECLKDNPAAWREMRSYNIRDTIATEQLYLKLRPWMVGHPNVASYTDREDVLCPKCGSDKVQMRGRTFTQSGEYHRFVCKGCGGWARSRYTLNSTLKRHALLSN